MPEPVDEVVLAEAALDALSSPTSSDVWREMHGHGAEVVAAIAAQLALAGGGGSLPDWWTVDSAPGSESVQFNGSDGGLQVGGGAGIGGGVAPGSAVAFTSAGGDMAWLLNDNGLELAWLGDVRIAVNATGLGFFSANPVARPEIPASPNAQDIADVLVALGLCTQAA